MEFKKAFRDNIQTIIAIFAITATVFSVLNFYMSSQLAPFEKRLVALEDFRDESMPIFTSVKTTESKVAIMYDDIKDIKSFLKLR
jgi:hypothetical protein